MSACLQHSQNDLVRDILPNHDTGCQCGLLDADISAHCAQDVCNAGGQRPKTSHLGQQRQTTRPHASEEHVKGHDDDVDCSGNLAGVLGYPGVGEA